MSTILQFKDEISMLKHSHKKKHSLEIWAVKLRFLLIYENMLKSIATVRSECTAGKTKKQGELQHRLHCS